MNLPLGAILVAALLLSLALLLLPEPGPETQAAPAPEARPGARPDLTIMGASLRSFGEDGALNWSMRSPSIAYHLDGALAFTAPNMLLHGTSNAQLRASAGLGTLSESEEEETIVLYSGVSAALSRGERNSDDVHFDDVYFNTERLIISEQGRQISAPESVRIASHSIDTRAAELDLDLQKQILLLASNSEERVTTRIQPMGEFE